MSTSILIAIPCRGGIEPLAVASLTALAATLTARGITFDFQTCTGDDLPCQRDWLARRFMEGECSHMLCLDADIAIAPDVVLRMLDREVNFAACTYRRKTQDPRVHDYLAVVSLEQELDEGTARAEAVGAGCMLLRRGAFERLYSHPTSQKYRTTTGEAIGVFQRVRADGALLGEDFSFCARWRSLGGQIALLVDADTVHASGLLSWPGNFREVWETREERPSMYMPTPEVRAAEVPC